MAASGYTPISLYYSTTASAAPTAGNLVSGELAINITDGKLYYKDNAGAVQLLSTSTTATGTANGVLYLNGSKVATSGTALVFDGTNLGIGGASSGVRLDVYGNINARSGTIAADAYTNYGTNLTLNSGGSLPMLFQLNGSEAMRLNSTGLGIGTSSPGAKLDVQGSAIFARVKSTSTTYNGFRAQNDNGNFYFGLDDASGTFYGTANARAIYADGAYPMVFYTNAAERMRLDSSGNLGIGTTSPADKLDVNGTIRIRGGNYLFLNNAANDSLSVIYNGGSTGAGNLQFNTGGAERARIDSSGNLLVGTTSLPLFGDERLAVVKTTGNGIGVKVSGTSYYGIGVWNAADSGTRTQIGFYDSAAGGFRGSITTNGSATAYNTSSDYRLKNIDGPLTGSGAFIDALKPKVGTWKADGSKFVGFLAHEVQEVSPGSVTGEKDGEEMQAMEYGSAEFIANIIAELQSLRKRLADAGIA